MFSSVPMATSVSYLRVYLTLRLGSHLDEVRTHLDEISGELSVSVESLTSHSTRNRSFWGREVTVMSAPQGQWRRNSFKSAGARPYIARFLLC